MSGVKCCDKCRGSARNAKCYKSAKGREVGACVVLWQSGKGGRLGLNAKKV